MVWLTSSRVQCIRPLSVSSSTASSKMVTDAAVRACSVSWKRWGSGGGAMIEFVDASGAARIKVVGVGGGGGNAVNTMIAAGLPGVDFIAANTDAQALKANLAPIKIQLGEKITKGLGAGANPQVGKKSAEEDIARIQEQLTG